MTYNIVEVFNINYDETNNNHRRPLEQSRAQKSCAFIGNVTFATGDVARA